MLCLQTQPSLSKPRTRHQNHEPGKNVWDHLSSWWLPVSWLTTLTALAHATASGFPATASSGESLPKLCHLPFCWKFSVCTTLMATCICIIPKRRKWTPFPFRSGAKFAVFSATSRWLSKNERGAYAHLPPQFHVRWEPPPCRSGCH